MTLQEYKNDLMSGKRCLAIDNSKEEWEDYRILCNLWKIAIVSRGDNNQPLHYLYANDKGQLKWISSAEFMKLPNVYALSPGNILAYFKREIMSSPEAFTEAFRNNTILISTAGSTPTEEKSKKIRRILKQLVPGDPIVPSGNSQFYYAVGYSSWSGCNTNAGYLTVKLDDVYNLLFPNGADNYNDRFPISLSRTDALRIIDIACLEWKNKLWDKWKDNIKSNEYILIDEPSYRIMRAACTKAQHELFDEIFGKDEPAFSANIGDLITVVLPDGKLLTGKYNRTGGENDVVVINKYGIGIVGGKSPRKATEDEIKEFNWPPLGTPCLVSDDGNAWALRYPSQFVDRFCEIGKKEAITKDATSHWKFWRVLDMNNLP